MIYDTTLVSDDFPREQARIRECLEHGREIGPAGRFYCAVAEDLLRRAEKAFASGDIIEIVRMYQEMRGFQS